MGKGGRNEDAEQVTTQAATHSARASANEKEARFMAALQRMMGNTELTEDNIRVFMQKLTPEQKAELLSEGQELKQELLTNQEHADDRNLFFKEFNRRSEEAGMPIDKDGSVLAKKITGFMVQSTEQLPQLLLLEALSSCPFLVKAAVAEARSESGDAGASASDLAEIEAALSLLKVEGWREGEASGRPPFVRRNLLLLHAHLHGERLNALALSDSTRRASKELVYKSKRLLDMVFSYSVQCGWIKALLAITELQSCLTNGLWGHTDDECLMSMKHKLTAVGLKLPKIAIRCQASDVAPGEKVTLQVALSRSHAHSAAEMEAYRKLQRDEAAQQQQVQQQLAEAGGADVTDPSLVEEEVEAKEGWFLMVESIRGHNGAAAQLAHEKLAHNQLAGAISSLQPTLDQSSISAEVEFDAPTTPGEYKVIVHIRSLGMIGVDSKRKVAFMVQSHKAKAKRPAGGTTDPCEHAETEADNFDLKAFEAAELKKKQEEADKKAKAQEELDVKNNARDAELAAAGKRAAGGMHKFDPDEVDVHGGNATADDFLDAFGF